MSSVCWEKAIATNREHLFLPRVGTWSTPVDEVNIKYGYLSRTSSFYFFPQARCKIYAPKIMAQARKDPETEITYFCLRSLG